MPNLSRSPSAKVANKSISNNNFHKNENNASYANRTPAKPTKLLTLEQLLKLI